MKDTYSIRELKRKTVAVVRAAEQGLLITVTRRDRPVVHVIATDRFGGLLETMELLTERRFVKQLRRLRAGKLKLHSASSLAD